MSKADYLDSVRVDPRLLGVPNILTPFAQNTSASRQSMLNHHLSQWMVLDNPEFPRIFTGFEHKFIDYTFNRSKRDHDCEIVEIIPKYTPSFLNIDDCPQIYVIVLTNEPNGVRHLDYFEINKYFSGNNGFGYLNKLENRSRLKVGEFLDKETMLTHGPTIIDDNLYSPGVNLKTIYGSLPETIEDAFVISEPAAKKLQTTMVSKVLVDFRQDQRPLNMYGDRSEDLILPNIGSKVREDGILCATRPAHWTTVLADTDPELLRKFMPMQDNPIYVPAGSTILDITFDGNIEKLNDCYRQPMRYMRDNNACWDLVWRTSLKYRNKYRMTPRMATLVRTALYRMIAQKHRPAGLESQLPKTSRNFDVEGANRQIVDFLQAEVVYTAPRFVTKGDKLTDFHGGKGVVGRVVPEDWMPIDEFGVRAEIWVDMNSPVARNNPGQFYETGINFISDFVRRKVEQISISSGSEPAFNTLIEYYKDVSPAYGKDIEESFTHPNDRKAIVEDAIKNGPRLMILPFQKNLTPSPENFWNALDNYKHWYEKWGAQKSRIRFKTAQRDGTGKEFVSREKFMIADKYWIHLHKIPEMTAPGPASVNHIGIPTKASHEGKHYPVSQNPYRYGEDELRVAMMDADTREVVRLQNLLANSPRGINTVIQTILTTSEPGNIMRFSISSGDLAASSAVGKLYHSVTTTLGVETKNTKIDKLDVPDYLGESIWNSNPADVRGDEDEFSEDAEEINRQRASSKRDKIKKMFAAATADEEDEDDDTSDDE